MNNVRRVTPIALRFSFEVRLPHIARRQTPRTLDLGTAEAHLREYKEFHAIKRSRSQGAYDKKLDEWKRALILRRSQRVQREPLLLRAVQSELQKRTKRLKLYGKQPPPPPFQVHSHFKRRRLMHKQPHPVSSPPCQLSSHFKRRRLMHKQPNPAQHRRSSMG